MVGTAGGLDNRLATPLVRIDAVLLSSAPEEVPETIAHEIFGHALSFYEAKKLGVAQAWGDAVEDEMLAEVVGDVVSRERGRTVGVMGEVGAELLKSTMAYARMQWFGKVGYAGQISLEEKEEPAAALLTRLDAQTEELVRLNGVLDQVHLWRRRIGHFTSVHGEPVSRYVPLWSYVDDMEAANIEGRANLLAARTVVYDNLRFLEVEGGMTLRRALRSPRYDGFLRARVAEIGALRARLATLGTVAPLPPVAGRVSHTDDAWTVLEKKDEADRKKHPDHWR